MRKLNLSHDFKITLAIITIVVALVLFFQVKACIVGGRDAKISKLEGELVAAEVAAVKVKADNKTAIDKMGVALERLEGEVATKNATILEYVKRDEAIIPTEIVDTPAEGQNWEQIAGVNAQAAREWREKYYESQKVIKDLGLPIEIGRDPDGKMLYRYPYDSITYKLDQRYLLAADQRDKALESLALTENLNRIQKSVIVQKDKKIAGLKLGKTIERVIAWPLAVVGGIKIGQAIFGL